MANHKRIRLVASALICTGALLLSACGGDDGGDAGDTTTTTAETTTTTEAPAELSADLEAAATTFAEENGVDAETSRCYAGELASGLDEARAIVLLGDEGTTDEAELEAVSAAAESCMTAETVAEFLVVAMTEEVELDDAQAEELRTCVAGGLEGKVGDFAAASERLDADPDDTDGGEFMSEVLDTCFNAELIATLIGSEAGATAEQIECLAGEFEGNVTFSQLIMEDPAAYETIGAAAETCGLQG